MPQASKSLKLRQSPLAIASEQLKLLGSTTRTSSFANELRDKGFDGLRADGLEIMQVNVGSSRRVLCIESVSSRKRNRK